MSTPIPPERVEHLAEVAVDTNKTAKQIDKKVTKPLPQRLAAFGLVMLALYLLIILGVSVKGMRSAVNGLEKTLPGLVTSNKTLTTTNKTLTDTNNSLTAQRDAALLIAQEQARKLREAGLPPVDAFDPAVTGVVLTPSPTTRPGKTQGKPSEGSQSPAGPRKPSASPSPSPSPKRSPAASPSPLVTVCVPPVPCVKVPPSLVPRLSVSGPQAGSLTPVPAVLNTSGDRMDSTYDFFNLDAAAVAKLVSLLMPLLVAVITRRYATSAVKGVLNFVLSTTTGSIGYLVGANGGYDVRGFVNAALNAVVVSGVAYLMLWKPTGIAGTVAVKTENFGIGREPELQTEDVGKEDAPGSSPSAKVRKRKRRST